jgi:hypothetical protein
MKYLFPTLFLLLLSNKIIAQKVETKKVKKTYYEKAIIKTNVANLIGLFPTIHVEQQIAKKTSIVVYGYAGCVNILGDINYSGLGFNIRAYLESKSTRCNGWYLSGGLNRHGEVNSRFTNLATGVRMDGGYQLVSSNKRIALDFGMGALFINSIKLRAMLGLGIQLSK